MLPVAAPTNSVTAPTMREEVQNRIHPLCREGRQKVEILMPALKQTFCYFVSLHILPLRLLGTEGL